MAPRRTSAASRRPGGPLRLTVPSAPPGALYTAALRRLEGRLWTGGAAHLVGGTLDLLEALLRYRLSRRGAAGP
jgi:hypothetical protein